MEPNAKFKDENAQKYYESLTSSEPGNPNKFEKPPIIEVKGGKSKSFRDITFTKAPDDKSDELLDPEVLAESIRGVLPQLAEEMNMPIEEAIFSPDFMDKITEHEGYDTTRFQLAYAIAYINLEPENFIKNPEASEAVARRAAEYLKRLLIGPDPELVTGDTQASIYKRVKEARNIKSKCDGALLELARREFIIRDIFEFTKAPSSKQQDASDQIRVEIHDNMKKSQDIISELEGILKSGLSEQEYFEWQASLEEVGSRGRKGLIVEREVSSTGEESPPRNKLQELHDTRVRFILKVGECLLDKDLPWSGRIQDARVLSTNFAVNGSSKDTIKYIALTCQFEFEPGKYVEITVLERPTRVVETDLETSSSTMKEKNATYVYVSRNPRTWMDVFGNSSQTGALNFGALGRTTEVVDMAEEVPVQGAKRVYHRDFSKYDRQEDQDAVIQEHLDRVVKVILKMQSEVLANIRA